ncbi:MAG: septum formation initiator family protein [Lachnospiraceae bacterium]|nr:septum formation initiator family protein [Lachnospiraceae bacterium]
MARRVAFRKKRQNRLGMMLVSFVVLMLMAVILFKGRELKAKQAEYMQREESLQAQIEEEHERTRKLTDYEKYTKTDKFVEEIAKEKLGLLYENEILFRSDINK